MLNILACNEVQARRDFNKFQRRIYIFWLWQIMSMFAWNIRQCAKIQHTRLSGPSVMGTLLITNEASNVGQFLALPLLSMLGARKQNGAKLIINYSKSWIMTSNSYLPQLKQKAKLKENADQDRVNKNKEMEQNKLKRQVEKDGNEKKINKDWANDKQWRNLIKHGQWRGPRRLVMLCTKQSRMFVPSKLFYKDIWLHIVISCHQYASITWQSVWVRGETHTRIGKRCLSFGGSGLEL